MIEFILNDQDIRTSEPPGTTVLDFVRYRRGLKGTKIGCREGDCGACTVLVGELVNEKVRYRTMTSCLMPLANAAGKHIVTIEGINPTDKELTPVQLAMADQSGTQCGFCTVGFVMSLTGFCIDGTPKTPEMAVSAIDGNICRCTGYKSIQRAAVLLSSQCSGDSDRQGLRSAVERRIVPPYFSGISERLKAMESSTQPLAADHRPMHFVGGGTDVYVQKPETMVESVSRPLLYDDRFRGIREADGIIEIGASATVTDLLESREMQAIFPDLYKHLKLVSSTPIRNMATLAGNFVNASPIGDMTVWFLALNAEIELRNERGTDRRLPLRELYLGYKKLARSDDEIITKIRFRKPPIGSRFNFEKVSKRTYLDIATVNTAISVVTEPSVAKVGYIKITEAHLSAGGVAPIPLYLKETSDFLTGKELTAAVVSEANDVIQTEISPISDVRGTEKYKRLLLKQLFTAHFVELFDLRQ